MLRSLAFAVGLSLIAPALTAADEPGHLSALAARRGCRRL